jgi:hypothetical protein
MALLQGGGLLPCLLEASASDEEGDPMSTPAMEKHEHYASCDCAPEDQHPLGYICEDCGEDVEVCRECSLIIAPCPCGHCPVGAMFRETESPAMSQPDHSPAITFQI